MNTSIEDCVNISSQSLFELLFSYNEVTISLMLSTEEIIVKVMQTNP